MLVRAGTYAGITATDDAAAMKTKIDAVQNAVIVSEIMWGLDLSQAVDAQARSQWIELYVHSTGKVAAVDSVISTIGTDIRVRISTGKVNTLGTRVDIADTATPDVTDDYIVVDLVSTIDRFGAFLGTER